MTAQDWIKQYENYLALVKNRSHNTVRGYVSDAEHLLAFYKGGWAAFKEEDAAEFVRELKRSATDTTIQRKIYSLKQFFRFLRKKGVNVNGPFDDMTFQRIRRPIPRTLTIQEMHTLLTCIRQPLPVFAGIPSEDTLLTIRDRAMLEVLYSAALRVSELVGLDWQDIDWNKRELRVLGKGNKERLCPLGQKALEALLEYGRHYEWHWKHKPEGVHPVFLSTWGRRIDPYPHNPTND